MDRRAEACCMLMPDMVNGTAQSVTIGMTTVFTFTIQDSALANTPMALGQNENIENRSESNSIVMPLKTTTAKRIKAAYPEELAEGLPIANHIGSVVVGYAATIADGTAFASPTATTSRTSNTIGYASMN
jgi:hypothetical protein